MRKQEQSENIGRERIMKFIELPIVFVWKEEQE